MKRRTFLAAASASGLAGFGGLAGARQGGSYLEQARQIGFGENWRQRRIGAADDWPMDARTQTPDRDQASTWTESQSFQSALDVWEPPSGWQDTAAGDVDTLQILNHGAANMEFDPATLGTYELFEEKTGISIEPLEIGVDQADLQEQQILSARQGQPHVMNIDTPLIPVFVQQGYLEVTDPLYSAENAWEPYVSTLQDVVQWDIDTTREGTHTYGFPNILEGSVGNLRTDLVEEQGIDPQRFQGEWSWDLLEEMMQAFEGTDVHGYAYYAGTPTYLFISFRQLLYQQGGSLVTDDGTVQFDTQPARTVLQKMYEWRDNGWVPGDVISYGEGDLVDLFLSDQLAYATAFGDFVPRALAQYEANDQYRVVLPPMANTGPNPQQQGLVAPNANGINPFADTGHKLAGLLFGDLRLSYVSQWWEYVYEGNMSYMEQVYDDAAEANVVQFADVIGSAVENGKVEVFPQMEAVWQRLADPFQQAIVGDMEPAQATQQAQQFVDQILGQ